MGVCMTIWHEWHKMTRLLIHVRGPTREILYDSGHVDRGSCCYTEVVGCPANVAVHAAHREQHPGPGRPGGGLDPLLSSRPSCWHDGHWLHNFQGWVWEALRCCVNTLADKTQQVQHRTIPSTGHAPSGLLTDIPRMDLSARLQILLKYLTCRQWQPISFERLYNTFRIQPYDTIIYCGRLSGGRENSGEDSCQSKFTSHFWWRLALDLLHQRAPNARSMDLLLKTWDR